MALRVAHYFFILSTLYLSTSADNAGYVVDKETRADIDKTVFTYVPGTSKWTAKTLKLHSDKTRTPANTEYFFFPGYRGILEGYGFEHSLSRFDKFKVRHTINQDELKDHWALKEDKKIKEINFDKPTIVGVIMRGGNSHNVVVALFFRWLKGEQVMFWRCRQFTETERKHYATSKKDNSDIIEQQLEDLLKVMESRGVQVLSQLTDIPKGETDTSIPPDVNVELTAFMPFTNIIGVVNGMSGQGTVNTEIFPKAHVGLDVIRRLIEQGAAQWEADVLTFYHSTTFDENKDENKKREDYKELCADKLRIVANPEGTTPIIGFAGHEDKVPGEYHLVVPAPIDQFLEARGGMDVKKDFYYKKLVVDVKDNSAIAILQNPKLYTDFDLLQGLAKLLKVDETEHNKPSMWTKAKDTLSRFRKFLRL